MFPIDCFKIRQLEQSSTLKGQNDLSSLKLGHISKEKSEKIKKNNEIFLVVGGFWPESCHLLVTLRDVNMPKSHTCTHQFNMNFVLLIGLSNANMVLNSANLLIMTQNAVLGMKIKLKDIL